VTVHFCPICSAQIYTSIGVGDQSRVIIKLGTLDEPKTQQAEDNGALRVGYEMFVVNRCAFLGGEDGELVEGAKQLVAGPTKA